MLHKLIRTSVHFVSSSCRPGFPCLHGMVELEMYAYRYMTDIDILASILACCAHDVGHPGVNNAFLVRTMDNLSIRFNDMSVLEQYHCSTGFSLIVDHVELNFLENWSLEDRKAFREVFVKNILATDMQEHFRLLGSFKNQLAEKSM